MLQRRPLGVTVGHRASALVAGIRHRPPRGYTAPPVAMSRGTLWHYRATATETTRLGDDTSKIHRRRTSRGELKQ
ncbi:hypothetical protein cu1510 [Corynebacterium urealyticum DSM 7109]|uniref:Uncharacterized protein n=1 Tax=Corynebacterium urealyticum (strain ATCC 43042 / DSM 7109) TaxID=504474 RepID=B1VI86_CORU7|nr:hypothetical protein cu1510 [Corynebacterium urealyticum DSM 7109]